MFWQGSCPQQTSSTHENLEETTTTTTKRLLAQDSSSRFSFWVKRTFTFTWSFKLFIFQPFLFFSGWFSHQLLPQCFGRHFVWGQKCRFHCVQLVFFIRQFLIRPKEFWHSLSQISHIYSLSLFVALMLKRHMNLSAGRDSSNFLLHSVTFVFLGPTMIRPRLVLFPTGGSILFVIRIDVSKFRIIQFWHLERHYAFFFSFFF